MDQDKRPTSLIPLYISHLIQTFGDRLWQFAVPILFTEIFTTSILPQSIFSFATFSAVFIFMPMFGSWIDNTDRLFVITFTIIVQNICIMISSVLLYFMADVFDINPEIDWKLVIFFGISLITSMIGQIMGNGATLALEKDWVVVLCNNNKNRLTTANARMRRIDLFCKLIAPSFFGIIIEYIGNTSKQKLKYGSIIIFGWNFIGLFLEYISIKYVYNKNTQLKITNSQALIIKQNKNGKIPETKKISNFKKLANGWNYYIKSGMFYASISYCMLYMSVLDGGSLVTAYLKMEGIPYVALGIAKGLGAIMGIIGTYLAQILHNGCCNNNIDNNKQPKMKMETIGVFTIWLFWIFLFPSILAFDDEKLLNKISILDNIANKFNFNISYIILFCMVIARIGLWAFDIAENQLMQDKVPENVRAQVNGVQVSTSQLFAIFINIGAMIFHETNQFYILVLFTIINIFFACVLYNLWYYIPCCKRDNYGFIDNDSDNNNNNNPVDEYNDNEDDDNNVARYGSVDDYYEEQSIKKTMVSTNRTDKVN